jgi:cell division septal protein FtsQ
MTGRGSQTRIDDRLRRPAALRPGARPVGGGRRTRPVRRASAGLTPTRAGALLVLLASLAAVYGVGNSDAFTAREVAIDGATWTSTQAVRAAVALAPGQNLFTLRTGPIEARLEALPAVRRAEVSVALPDTLRVVLLERQPLLAWGAGDRQLLVDEDGLLFAELPRETVLPDPLPLVDDRRPEVAALRVGGRLDPVTLDAALRLGSLVPADVGSAAAALTIRLDDTDGFLLESVPGGWTAVFGFYTPTLRTTALIPGQVRLLRSLLVGREPLVARVVLADDRNGTFIPRPTPSPTP